MKIKRLVVGELECNCYLLEKNLEYLLIDPGADLDKIKNLIKDKKIIGILITHSHFDHIGCVSSLIKDYNIKVYDFSNLEEKKYNIGSFSFEVIYTPGHKEDCISYYFYQDNVMFTGDFLFKNNIGRCDLAGGDFNIMATSIEKIKKYNDNIIIYPGHGDCTILGDEKQYNYYFN